MMDIKKALLRQARRAEDAYDMAGKLVVACDAVEEDLRQYAYYKSLVDRTTEADMKALTSSPRLRRGIPYCVADLAVSRFDGFLLRRDCPEEQGLVFAANIPTRGILRVRANRLFPQVSLSLHRLTRHALPPCHLLAHKRQKGKNSLRSALHPHPYGWGISARLIKACMDKTHASLRKSMACMSEIKSVLKDISGRD